MILKRAILRPVTDQVFLGTKVRGLRSKIFAGPELAELASIPSPLALYQKILGTDKEMTPSEAQRAIIVQHVNHLMRILNFTGGARYALFEWLVRRYQAENLKVIARAWLRKLPLPEIEKDLLPLPEQFALPFEKMLAAPDAATLISLAGVKELTGYAQAVTPVFSQDPRAFYLEAAIDKAFYTRAVKLAKALGAADRGPCLHIFKTEIMCYNLLFVLRCMQIYELSKESFADLVVEPSHFAKKSYIDLVGTAPVEKLLESVPSLKFVNRSGRPVTTLADFEEILTRYLYRVIVRQYVLSGLDFGVVVAYYYMKYYELRDILRLGEAIRLGVPASEAVKRLITAGEENV